ncbi:MAG TPA: phosphopantetheine-binding protein [Candidatus Angelobacter sp.]
MNQEAIALSELRTAVFEAVNASAIPPREPGESLEIDMRLANLGIDSLGIVMLLLELSSRTGLNLERRNGMAPLRTVSDIIDFSLQMAQGTPHTEADSEEQAVS